MMDSQLPIPLRRKCQRCKRERSRWRMTVGVIEGWECEACGARICLGNFVDETEEHLATAMAWLRQGGEGW